MTKHSLEIINLTKKYGDVTALSNINLTIEEGAFVGLLGVNGAGKTSLISSISGLNQFGGQIKVMGYDVMRDDVKAKKNIGVVPQELAFDPFLTVYQTLKLQSGLYGVRNNKEWIFEILERLHLADKANNRTRALSGGMKRRLMVAQALVHKPPLIILDEPTTGVDVEIRRSLWGFITELHKKGHTMLLTTHYLEEVEQLCEWIVLINKGKIIAQNNKDELMSQCTNLVSSLEITTGGVPFRTHEIEPYIVKSEGNTLTLKLDNSNKLATILNIFQEHNVDIKNININHPSLEDVFINFIHR